MPRKRLIISDVFPYHVRGRCLNREWFKIPIDEVWTIFSHYLFFISHAYEVEIISFVLMNNHFHLIIRTPLGNLSEVMNYFMRETSRVISMRSGRINQIYGGPYQWSLINNDSYYFTAYKYVYRNPVAAGITDKVESYPFSTLQGLLGLQSLVFPCYAMDELFSDTEEQLRWLNQPFDTEQSAAIKNALQKKIFKIGKNKNGEEIKIEAPSFSSSLILPD